VAIKPLDDRLRDGFDPHTLDKFGLRYLEAIIESWRESEQTMRRTLAFAGLLVVIFFLLTHAKTAEVTLGPLKLTNVAAILILIPTLVAFLGHEWMELLCAAERYESVSEGLTRLLAPSLHENDLDVLLAPPVVHPYGRLADRSWMEIRSSAKPASRKTLEFITYLVVVVVLLGSIAFLVYSYIYLYGDPHANAVPVSIGLAVTAVYAVRTIAVFVYT
jgi:hypothetical protein